MKVSQRKFLVNPVNPWFISPGVIWPVTLAGDEKNAAYACLKESQNLDRIQKYLTESAIL